MRHADDNFLHAEIAAALDDLFQRRDQRFGAVQAKALGAGEFEIAEFLEAFGLDQLHQDGAPAFAGETDFLVRALDALLNPGFLRAVGDVHELDAERLAVGAFADRDDFAQTGVFEAKHVIEEDLAVEIALHEAVGARIEFLAVARRFDPERVELGVKMAAHAVGPDQHQGTHRVARRLVDVGRHRRDALGRSAGLSLGRELAADNLFDLGPVAVERGGQIVTRRQRPVVAAPGRALGVFQDVCRLIFQALEKLLPFGVDRGGVFLVAGVDIVNVGGVGSLEERGESKCGIRVLARHDCVLVISVRAWKTAQQPIRAPDQHDSRPLTYITRMFAPKRTKNWIKTSIFRQAYDRAARATARP